MKKNPLSTQLTLLQTCKSYVRLFNNKWLIAFLLVIFAAGCKKVTEVSGIVNVCPVVVSTDPLDKAVDVALGKLISVTFNTDINPTTVNAASFSIKHPPGDDGAFKASIPAEGLIEEGSEIIFEVEGSCG